MELAQWDVQQRLWLEQVQALGFRQVGVGKLICESWKKVVREKAIEGQATMDAGSCHNQEGTLVVLETRWLVCQGVRIGKGRIDWLRAGRSCCKTVLLCIAAA